MLTDLLRATADRSPSKPALVVGDARHTFDEVLEWSAQLAGGLEQAGIGPGDRVVVLLRNGPEFLVTFFAVTGIGATALLLDPASRSHELEHACEDCEPRAIVADSAGMARWLEATRHLPEPEFSLTFEGAGTSDPFWQFVRSSPSLAMWQSDPDLVATYQYSSGSTGRAKRIGRTNAQWRFEAEAFAAAAGHGADDVVLCALPMFHAYGLGYLITATALGATIVVQERVQPFTLHRAETLELARAHEATILPAAPFMLDLLAAAPGPDGLPTVRYCAASGAPLTKETFDVFDARFGIPIRQEYGSTEAGKIAVNSNPEPRPTWASVGKPIPGVTLLILDDEDDAAPSDTIGRIALRSPGLTTDHPYADSSESPYLGDLFLTGDVGRLDAEGNLTIVGRTKVFLDVLGEKVDPTEVEEVLVQHPAVKETVVVGVPDSRSGATAVKAAVVLESDCDERELIRFCKERLASYKAPSLVEFRDEIPRSPIGKILRKELIR